MIAGRVVANAQWSGDAVYTMDQAEEDGVYLEFAMPEEASNIYFDGWVMLKSGIDGDAAKQHAAEASAGSAGKATKNGKITEKRAAESVPAAM